MDACPPLEDIAAFIDDMLPVEERARITEHLARCESCYEIFAGAVHFQVDEEKEKRDSSADGIGGRDVIPFPLKGEQDRRISRWLPLAASVVLAAGLGFFAWQLFAVPREMALDDLTEPLQRNPGLTDSLYDGQTYRGNEHSGDFPLEDAKAFLASVYLVDLHLSVQAGDSEQALRALHSLGSEVKEIGFLGGLGERYQKESASLESEEGIREFAKRLPDEEENIRELLSLYEPFYSFGLWAEAGRLAAKVESSEFFETRKNRRFLSHLQKTLPKELPEELQEPVLDDLEAIERTWDAGDLSREDYEKLATRLQNIIKQIDEYEEVLLPDE